VLPQERTAGLKRLGGRAGVASLAATRQGGELTRPLSSNFRSTLTPTQHDPRLELLSTRSAWIWMQSL
jgi:hypothetical protein